MKRLAVVVVLFFLADALGLSASFAFAQSKPKPVLRPTIECSSHRMEHIEQALYYEFEGKVDIQPIRIINDIGHRARINGKEFTFSENPLLRNLDQARASGVHTHLYQEGADTDDGTTGAFCRPQSDLIRKAMGMPVLESQVPRARKPAPAMRSQTKTQCVFHNQPRSQCVAKHRTSLATVAALATMHAAKQPRQRRAPAVQKPICPEHGPRCPSFHQKQNPPQSWERQQQRRQPRQGNPGKQVGKPRPGNPGRQINPGKPRPGNPGLQRPGQQPPRGWGQYRPDQPDPRRGGQQIGHQGKRQGQFISQSPGGQSIRQGGQFIQQGRGGQSIVQGGFRSGSGGHGFSGGGGRGGGGRGNFGGGGRGGRR